LNINHFKIIEAVGLKIITSSLTWMALPSYLAVQKLLAGGHTDRQIDWRFDKPTFIFGK
jgi:hypothetical protein